MSNTLESTDRSTQAADDLAAGMAGLGLKPLWELYSRLVKREPQAAEPAWQWRWRELEPLVALASEQVRGEAADHRALILANPQLTPRVLTTTNLIAAMQCVLPGERTLEHRHTASACRLILEGDGGMTFVNGRRCRMQRNDFILTPNWTWHAHRNDSATRAVWLDMLDVPLMGALDTTFGEYGPAPAYPAVSWPEDGWRTEGLRPCATALDAEVGDGRVDLHACLEAPRLRWAWVDVVEALEKLAPQADGTKTLRYCNPIDGGAMLPTLDASVVELPRDRWAGRERRSSNAILVVLEGEGESDIGGRVFKWSERDVLTLPHWQWTRHRATGSRARLLRVSDGEALRRLGLERIERGE